MDHIRIQTDRLILRRFEENDMKAIYLLFSDNEVNTFLPWYPVKDMNEAKNFFEKRLKDKDKRRAAYYKKYTETEWGVAANYHIALDSGKLGIEKCVDILTDIYKSGL